MFIRFSRSIQSQTDHGGIIKTLLYLHGQMHLWTNFLSILKPIEIFIEIPIGYGFPTTYCISRWLMKSPNCILKRVSLRLIFYMPKGNDVKTLSMEFYWLISLRYIDVLKWIPPPLKSHSGMNSYFQINYSHCCTMFPCLNTFWMLFVSLMIDWVTHDSVYRHQMPCSTR